MVVLVVGIIVVFVVMYGFNVVLCFLGICVFWLFVMFISGLLVFMLEFVNVVIG